LRHEAHAVLQGAVLLRNGLRMRRELPVQEAELDAAADLKLHLPARQPLAALVRFGEIGPNPLDRAGQQALEAQGVGVGSYAEAGHCTALSCSGSALPLLRAKPIGCGK